VQSAMEAPHTALTGASRDIASARVVSPSAERNKQHIGDVILKFLPAGATRALEVASGTGQHVAHFAQLLPTISWQPTDLTSELFPSIASYTAPLGNVLPPVLLDASAAPWAVNGTFDIVECINMTHISPWEATVGLMRGAAQVLRPSGVLFVYGPFLRDGKHTTESNAQFDASLRARDPAWGYRDVADVAEVARSQGLRMLGVCDMPANNHTLVFEKHA
jgi:SAM-dependent methyltransferase